MLFLIFRKSPVPGWRYIILYLAFIFMGNYSFAQEEYSDVELEYLRVRELAFAGKLDEARKEAYLLLGSNPGYGDAAVLLARITAWQGQYEPAIRILDSLLLIQPGHTDAVEARDQISTWKLSSQTPDELPAKMDDLASDTIDYSQSIMLKGAYYLDSFQEPYTRFWELFSAGAEYNSRIGKVAGGINLGHLYTRTPEISRATEFQISAEAYPVISERVYSYLAWSYSPGEHFPTHYGASGIWYSIGKGWVASAGGAFYYFDRAVFIPYIMGEKYVSRYWLSGKMKMHFKEPGSTVSVILTARRYFSDITYFQISASSGTAPDEPWDISGDMNRQNAVSVNLLGNIMLGKRFVARGGFGYSSEQYADALRRDRFEAIVGLNYLTGWKP